ncbi:hypothetical protein [Gordonia sp. 'Campus']|uniref:hypothetical protein n=1 Tax=Gordonia sp. 'Campus' TaxID=2915824 RepID=UPI001EE43D6A|nr:hypothetical protein [Gordonia sp. 'Campus']
MRARVIGTSIVGVVVALVVSASATGEPSDGVGAMASPAPGIEVLGGGEPQSVLLSRELYARSDEAILLGVGAADDPAVRDHAGRVARERHVPVLAVTPRTASEVSRELRRLGVTTEVRLGRVDGIDDGRETVDLAAVRGNAERRGPEPLMMMTHDAPVDAALTARSAARVVELPVPDPRSTAEAIGALDPAGAGSGAIRAVGPAFGSTAEFARRVDQARTTPELPGGGQVVFPGRRMVALYGSPGAPALGPLGRQDIPASIERARRLAADYQRVSAEPVVPAFEIIATVASAEPGPGSTYTNMIDPETLRPWVEAAGRAGVYVTLDLQPGRMDFLAQARRYADLLAQPHVGLALDPEWRLKPDQVHLTQIGSVGADEVNRTSAWLADLVRSRHLPQKLFVLHQFDAGMLADRGRIVTDRDELQVVVHADGHGAPDVKMETWRRLITDLPAGVWMGWKNFYTEDKPTFSPETTLAVRPSPWFVSYQ